MIHSPIRDPPPDLPVTDITVATLVAFLLLFSLTSVSFILYFHLFSSSRRSDKLRNFNSLWAVRVLLIAFSCIWALAELLRLPHLLHLLFYSTKNTPATAPRLPPIYLCRAYVLASHGFAEPCFFATLLFLLQASMDESLKERHPNAFASALTVSLGTSLPFFLLHALFLSPISAWVLRHLGIVPEIFGRVIGGVGVDDESPESMRCSYPLFSTVLLAGFGAVYVPWFASVCWSAVSVVINKRLRLRLYALVASVVLALSMQVSAFALTAFWNPNDAVFQGLGLTGFLAVLTCALIGQGVLVVRPIRDAIEVGCWCHGSGGGGGATGGLP